jgi:hypothetical protein
MLCLAVLAGCAEAPEATLDVATYEREIADWHLQREARLKGPEGWLNLAGLFWLEAGRNTLGSDPDNDIVIPQARAAMHIGELVVEAGAVRFTAAPGADVNSDGNAIDTLTLIDERRPSSQLADSAKPNSWRKPETFGQTACVTGPLMMAQSLTPGCCSNPSISACTTF